MASHTYANWKAPSEDAKSLVWPAPVELVEQTRANLRSLGESETLVQNVPLKDIRHTAREFLGHRDSHAPLIATGHQAELHHPGVWVKNAMIDALAIKMSGAGYHIAVDTDEPKHLNLRWPGVSESLTDDPTVTSAAWSGLVNGPTPAHVEKLQGMLKQARTSWAFHPVADEFLGNLKLLSMDPAPLPKVLTAALHQLDWSLGLRYHALLASPIWESPAYLLFAHHVLARAGDFAATYNGALADYRHENGIKTPGRPMPNLRIADREIEAPFWVDDVANGSRVRCAVHRDGAEWAIEQGGDVFTFSPDADGWDASARLATFLRCHQLRLSPRALTLTLFLRLFLADQFVHGIGGGRYDQVTDRLIERHFNIPAPHFSVTTATLFFPASRGRTRACLPCIAQEGHRLRHELLGERKQEMVSAIDGSPRNSLQRREIFARMHTELANALAADPPRLRDWENRYSAAVETSREDSVIFDRELFYGLQTRDKLAEMISRYREELGIQHT